MPISFNCPGCGQGYKVPDSVAGKTTKCKKCGGALTIPAATAFAQKPLPAAVAPEPPPMLEPADEDSPVQPLRRQRKKSPLAVALVGGAALLLGVVLPGILVYGFYAYFLGGSSGLGDGMKFLPDNCQFVASIQVEEIMNCDTFKEFKKQVPDVAKEMEEDKKGTGMPLDNIAHVLVGGGVDGEPLIVLTTKKAMTAEEILANIKPKKKEEEKVGRYTLVLYRKPGIEEAFEEVAMRIGGDPNAKPSERPVNHAFCVDGKQVVIGDIKAVRAVLTRDKKPDMSEGLKAALKQTDLSKSVAWAMNVKDAVAKKKPALGNAQFEKGINSVEAVAGQVNLKGDVKVDVAIVCKDAPSAEELRKLAEGGIVMAKNFGGAPSDVVQILESIKFATSGTTLTASLQIKSTAAVNSLKGMADLGKPAQKKFNTVGEKIGP